MTANRSSGRQPFAPRTVVGVGNPLSTTSGGWGCSNKIGSIRARPCSPERSSLLKGPIRSLAPITLLRGLRRDWPDDPLEIRVRARIAMDRYVRRHIQLQPLEIAIQHNGVVAHIGQVSTSGRRAVEVRIDHDLVLRAIGNQHVVAVVETIDVIEL